MTMTIAEPQSPSVDNHPMPATQAQTISVHRVNLLNLLRGQVGRFVGIDFVKKDGSARSLNGRLGVAKHCGSGTASTEREDLPYLVMYDMKAEGYRAVNLATVGKVRAMNTDYAVIG